MQLLDFNDIALPDRAVGYEIPATVAISRMDIAGARIGGYVLGAHHDTRKYAVNGLYLRELGNDMSADRLIDQLRGAMGSIGVLRQKMRDGSIRRCNAWLTKYQPTHDNQSAATRAQPVAIEFESDGFWHEETAQNRVLANAVEAFCANAGNVACVEHFRIEITSAIVAPLTITNTRNNYVLTYDAAKVAGVVLAIDCGAGTVLSGGVNAYGNTSRSDTQMELMRLEAGWNRLAFNQAVTGVVSYRYAWI
jgi:hypothetical protein